MTLPQVRVRSRKRAAVRVLLLSTMSISGSAHARHIFGTEEGPRLRKAIVGFLEGLKDARHPRPSPWASVDTEGADG